MKTPNQILPGRSAGITLLEVVVVIFVVVVFVGILMPPRNHATPRVGLTDSLSNAKQIGTALRMYADDHDGKFPFSRADGTPLGPGDSSNQALEQLMPAYSTSKKLFLRKTSAWCRNPAVDTQAADSALLKRGQNDWNYVVGLSAPSYFSDSRWPLIATATKSAVDLTYTNDMSAKGGVWGGTDAIIAYVDGSARRLSDGEMNLTDKTKTFPKRPDTGTSIFTATPEWLGPGTFILAPE